MKRFLVVLAFAGCLFSNAVLADDMAKAAAMAHFVNTDGDMIGEAQLWQGPRGVVIVVQINGWSRASTPFTSTVSELANPISRHQKVIST